MNLPLRWLRHTGGPHRSLRARARGRTRELRRDAHALLLAIRDPRTPWYAKLTAVCVVAYALSPIDLIPDPIPLLGYLDDLVLVPLGIMLIRKLVPDEVLAECRIRAERQRSRAVRIGWIAAGIIISIWIVVAGLIVAALVSHFTRK